MPTPLRLLLLDDRPDTLEPLLAALRLSGFEPLGERAATEADYLAALQRKVPHAHPEVIVAALPRAHRAWHQLRAANLNRPFFILAPSADDPAVRDILSQGAADCVTFDQLNRLGWAVQQALDGQRLRTEKRRAEEALHDSETRLRLLNGILIGVTSGLPVDDIIRRTLKRLGQAFSQCRIGYATLDARAQLLWLDSSEPPDGPGLRGHSLRLTDAPEHLGAIRRHELINVEDVTTDAFSQALITPLQAAGIRAWLAVGLRHSQQLNGVLSFDRPDAHEWTDHEAATLTEVADYLSLAIGNARLFAETTEALHREQRLDEVTRIISGALELPMILQQVVRLAAELVGAEAGALALLDSTQEQLTYPYVFNLPGGLAAATTTPGADLVGDILLEREGRLVDDHAAHPRANPDLAQAGVRAFIGVPLLVNEAGVGVLGLFCLRSEMRFTARDLALAESVGRQAGIAIQNARLFETQRRRLAALTALHQTGLDLSTQPDLSTLLRLIVERAAAMLDAPMGGIYLLQADGKTLELAVSVTGEADFTGVQLQRGEGVAGLVAESGQPLVINDYNQWPRRVAAYQASGFRSVLGVPIKWQTRTLGVLDVVDTRPNRFGQEDVEIVSLFADQTAMAIVNVRQHNNLRRRLQESEAMSAISRALNETLNTERIFQMIVDAARRIIPQVERAVIHLLEEEQQTLRPAAVAGAAARRPAEIAMRPGEGVAGQVMAEGAAINVTDTLTDRRYLPLGRTARLRSLLVAPVQSGQRRLGTISVQSPEPNAFSADDEWLLTTLGVQAALAIENARLFEQNARLVADLEKALQQEKTARAQMVQSEKLAAMGRLVASVAHELNNPLQAIQNALYLVKQEKGLGAQAREDLQVALTETDRMAELISRLRETYRPATREEYQLESLNLLVEEVRRLIATHMRHSNVTCVIDADPALPPVRGLKDQLKQALLNLSLNAVEAMPDGGQLTIRTYFDDKTNGVWLSLSDTGQGIPPEALPNVFDPFFTTKETGTGLGLAITHDIIRRHGGHIEVQSEMGRGATFRLWLPV